MKKKILLSFFFCICGIIFSQETIISDIILHRDISQSFENKYYPRTVEKVDLLQQLYPDSVFLQSALVYKAKSLMELDYHEQATITLKDALTHMHTGKDDFILCYYLLGQSYFHLERYKEALDSFYAVSKLSLIHDETQFYNSSILYAADSFFKLEKYKEATGLYEYVIENGLVYSKKEYENAFINLLHCYSQNGDYAKVIDLYNTFDIESSFFNENVINIFYNYVAEACENEGKFDIAFNIYKKLLHSGDNKLSKVALHSIYNLQVEKKFNVDITKLIDDLSLSIDSEEEKELLNEIYIRFGIEEYNNNNYEKAGSYFSKTTEDSCVSNIYKAKMILDKDSSKKAGKQAEDILLKCNKLDIKNNVGNISDSYYSILLQCKIQQDSWEGIPDIFCKIKSPDSKSVYINSSYYYKNGCYEKVAPETGILYASALCKLQKYQEACVVFDELDKKNQLNDKDFIEYGKALFILEKYDTAYSVVKRSNDLQKDYILGLCKINMKELPEARKLFMNYIKKASNSSSFNELSFYYKGYIEYGLKEYRNAYASFIRFISEAGSETDNKYFKYVYKSYKYAAISALENNDSDNAIFYAYNVIKFAETEDDKLKATRFCFEVLNDCKDYAGAIELLKPYTQVDSEFTDEALFKIAKTYEKQDNPKKADLTYNQLYSDYPDSQFAEEALYRSCEIYYFEEDYFLAYRKFNEYVYKYPKGKFSDSALYFSGDCALRLGEINKSIMINKNLISKYPDSKYVYSANKNLISAYYEQEEYENALEVSMHLLNKYSEQAELDKIEIKISELERIVNGTDRRIAEKLSQYELAGEIETKRGRTIGSELVKLYATDYYMQEYAYNLAVELLGRQTEDEEFPYAAENAEFAGDYSRKNNENEEAAEFYLKSAKCYRSIENSIKASAVLYSAAEAFVASGLIGDARETADLLKRLYPDSKYAEQVDRIVK